MLYVLSLILVILAILLLGLITITVIQQTKKTTTNVLLIILGVSMSLWIMANFIGSQYRSSLFLDLDLALGLIAAAVFRFLVLRLVDSSYKLTARQMMYLLPVSILIASVFTGSIAKFVGDDISYGKFFYVYALYAAFLIVSPMVALYGAYIKTKSQKKAQYRALLKGFIISGLIIVLPNILLPLITDDKNINYLVGNISYYGPVIVAITILYSATKHNLFDIKFIALRWSSYIVTLILALSIYYFVIFNIFESYLVDNVSNDYSVIAIFFLAIIASLIFRPLENGLKKITFKIFYQGAYDTQDILAKITDCIIRSKELRELSLSVEDVLTKDMYLEMAQFLVFTGNSTRYYGQKFNEINLKIIHDYLKSIKEDDGTSVLWVDEDYGVSDSKIHIQELKSNIICIAVFNIKKDYKIALILGRKKNDRPYWSKDISMLNTIVQELSIAFINFVQFEEIANFNVTLQKKIEDATRELKRSNDKLQALDTAKDEFISMASHQLRTPLTSVKGYVSMVLEGDAGPISDQQRQLLQQAFVSSQRMVYLIADLLNVSRLRTGKFIIEAKPTYLPDVVQSELEQLSDTAKARGLDLVFNKPAKFPLLMLDETKIRQVIMNFTDNAIYYTPTGGRIEVALNESPRAIELTVNDNGIGVPKKEQHHLFTKFYRAGNAKKARPDGTGLGLFMAKKVIVSQGGAVIFRSLEGKGSTFGFTFPKDKLKVGAPPYT